jgi:NAD(P)-dependent dehydrogenase (short-subunit alcohol dehydrogenase family)
VGDRRALVTGGATGIGRAISVHLARHGHRVVALGRDTAALGALVDEAADEGLSVRALACDVAAEDQVGAALAELGPVDVLVNNAGVAETAPVHRIALADWEHHLRVNATAALLTIRTILPGMRERDWGRIVAVASTAAKVGSRYTASYTASKHAVLGLTRAVAAETAGSRVTSNAVCPAFVRSPMTERSVARIAERTGRTADEAEAELAGAAPLGRLVEPDEVAAAVGYLVSDLAGCVNGQALVLDGGGIQE